MPEGLVKLELEKAGYNPNQARDEGGRWSTDASYTKDRIARFEAIANKILSNLGLTKDDYDLYALMGTKGGNPAIVWQTKDEPKPLVLIRPQVIREISRKGFDVVSFRGIIAHEGTHLKERQYMRRSPDNREWNWVVDNREELGEEGGVSTYSNIQWRRFWKYNNVKKPSQKKFTELFKTAVSETLAEMSHVKMKTGTLPGGPKFKELYGKIFEGAAIAKAGYDPKQTGSSGPELEPLKFSESRQYFESRKHTGVTS